MALRTPENADRICALLGEGYTLRQVVKEIGVGSGGAIHDWSREDAVFGEQYARAMQRRHERMAEEIQEISDDGTNDWMEREGIEVANHEHIQRSKLRVDSRRWLLSKMLPKQYGDRTTVAGDPDAPLSPPVEPAKIALGVLALLAAAKDKEPKG